MLCKSFSHGIALVAVACGMATYASGADIAHWNFDEIQDGGVVPDVAGNAHARVMGGLGTDFQQPGLNGRAIHLDMAKNHLRVDGSYAPNLQDDFTIRCVIFPFNVDSYRTILWKGDRQQVPEAVNFYLGIRDKKIEFKSKDDQGRWMVHQTEPVLQENAWYDIAVYFKDGVVEVAVNGKECAVIGHTDEGADALLVPNEAPLIIGQGANHRGDAFHFFGLIDEIKISEGRHLDPDDQWENRLEQYDSEKAAGEQKKGADRQKQREQWLDAYAAMFQERAGSAEAPFFAVTLPSTRRINKSESFLQEIKDLGTRVQLSAAGNEYEGSQILVVSRADRDAGRVQVRLSDLESEAGGKLPSTLASWGWLKSIETEKPDIAVDFVGKIPDVIIEGDESFDVRSQDFTPILVRYYVPAGTPGGTYRGTVTLSCGGYQESIPVELQVFSFQLPEKGSLRVSFSFFEDYYREWHNVESLTDEQKRGIYQYLLKYRIPPANIYTNLPVYPELRFLEELKDKTNFFTVQGWGEVLDAKTAEAKVEEYRKTLEEIRKIGMEDSLYFYGIDELSVHLAKKLPAAQQAHSYLSKAFPELRTMQTSYPLPEIQALYNVWVPLMDSFGNPGELGLLEKFRKETRELWWYAADLPVHPYPNFYLDYPVFDSRIVMTLTYKYQLKGILYWAINREWKTNMAVRSQWPEADWKPYIFHISQGYRKQRNGMGNLVYPRKEGGMYASLRLENVRDGLEDYEYLKVLENLTNELEKAKGAVPEVVAARELLVVPPEVAVAVDQYNADPAALMEYRANVAAMIDRVQKANL